MSSSYILTLKSGYVKDCKNQETYNRAKEEIRNKERENLNRFDNLIYFAKQEINANEFKNNENSRIDNKINTIQISFPEKYNYCINNYPYIEATHISVNIYKKAIILYCNDSFNTTFIKNVYRNRGIIKYVDYTNREQQEDEINNDHDTNNVVSNRLSDLEECYTNTINNNNHNNQEPFIPLFFETQYGTNCIIQALNNLYCK